MNKIIEFLGWIFMVIGIIAIFAVIVGYPIMWLWNWIMPILFNLPKITFFQSIGLYILCNLLFKSSISNDKKTNN